MTAMTTFTDAFVGGGYVLARLLQAGLVLVGAAFALLPLVAGVPILAWAAFLLAAIVCLAFVPIVEFGAVRPLRRWSA